QARVVDAAFFERQFPPNYLVARGSVALELDAPHVKLLSLVDIDFQVRQFLLVVEGSGGNAGVVDVSVLAVGLAQVLEALRNLLAAENVAILQRKKITESRGIGEEFVVLERDLAQPVLVP